MTSPATRQSPIQALRQQHHQRWMEALHQKLAAALQNQAPSAYAVYLFGSRARGDWDGYSDTDLLVVAPSPQEAEAIADHLRDVGVGDDVIALEQARWLAMDQSPSPYWRAIKAQALLLAECTQ